MDGPTGNIPAGLLAHRWARIPFHRTQQGDLGAGICMNPASHQSDSVRSDMGIGITGQNGHGTRQNFRLLGATRAPFASVAIEDVQGHATDPLVRVVQHCYQIVHHVRHQELIEELAAAQAHVAALVAKPLPDSWHSGQPGFLQRPKSLPGVMRYRQLAQQSAILLHHVFSPSRSDAPPQRLDVEPNFTEPASDMKVRQRRLSLRTREDLGSPVSWYQTRRGCTRVWTNLRMNTAARRSIDDLLAVMAALRTPDTGCPWDLEQSFRTIAPYTIEEAYEVADAIERGDLDHLREELGDLLLQVVYHSRMAEEQGAFAFADVVEAVTAKMVRRHPHVFGTAEERAAGAAPGFWERIKAAERAESPSPRATPTSPETPSARGEGRGEGQPHTPTAGSRAAPHPHPLPASGEREPTHSVLDGVPVALPALTRAVKLQDKAARVGFDWPSLAPVFDKLKEELADLEEAIATVSDPPGLTPSHQAKIEEEFGDLLFVVANVARHLKLDPEAALRSANQKFTRRFHAIEEKLAAQGRTPAQSTLAEMDRLWDEAKGEER